MNQKSSDKYVEYADFAANFLADVEANGIDAEGWDSLVINRRKPETLRVFKQFGDKRVCFHVFGECGIDDSFTHPHGWPAFVLVTKGAYAQRTWLGSPKEDESNLVLQEVVTAGSTYFIDNTEVFHQIIPSETTWTMMVNGPPYEKPNDEVRTTKGKDLEKMTESQKIEMLYLAISKALNCEC